MVPEKAAQSARDHIDPPWDDLRAARVQQRVLAELSSPGRRPVKRANRTWLALAAAACLAAALVLVLRTPSTSPSHLEFDDGSVADLTGDAQVVPVVVSNAQIELRHVRGSVRYDVAHRPGRSFLVRAGAVTVRVIGTSFQVNRHDQKVEVHVRRGRVEVTRGGHVVVLSDGEQVVLDDGEVTEPVASASWESDDTIEVEALPAASDMTPPSLERTAAELFRAADDARAAGNAEGAIQLLGELVRTHPKDPRVTMAVFTMGRLHMQQGRAAQAAQSFESCGNALGGEALAEAALAHASAGNAGRGRTLASQYLERFPEGPRIKEMARLAGR